MISVNLLQRVQSLFGRGGNVFRFALLFFRQFLRSVGHFLQLFRFLFVLLLRFFRRRRRFRAFDADQLVDLPQQLVDAVERLDGVSTMVSGFLESTAGFGAGFFRVVHRVLDRLQVGLQVDDSTQDSAFGFVFLFDFLMKVVDDQLDVVEEILEFGVVDVFVAAGIDAFQQKLFKLFHGRPMDVDLLLNESVTARTSAALSAVRLESVHVFGAAVATDALHVLLATALSVVAALRREAAVGVATTISAARKRKAVETHGALNLAMGERGREETISEL